MIGSIEGQRAFGLASLGKIAASDSAFVRIDSLIAETK